MFIFRPLKGGGGLLIMGLHSSHGFLTKVVLLLQGWHAVGLVMRELPSMGYLEAHGKLYYPKGRRTQIIGC